MGRENRNKVFFGALIFIPLLLLLPLSSSIAYAAELTPPLPGAPNYIDISVEKAHEMVPRLYLRKRGGGFRDSRHRLR